MRGAKRIDAIEIDEFAYTNACENLRLNNAELVDIHLGDAALLSNIKDVDLFIANINRNIITADLPAYVSPPHSRLRCDNAFERFLRIGYSRNT